MNRGMIGLALVCALSVGCGPKMASVSGTVKWSDGAPIEGAFVNFTPKDGKGHSATGTTDASGNFTLMTDTKSGASVGEYDVLITKGTSKVGTMTPEQSMAAMSKNVAKKSGAGPTGGPGMMGMKGGMPKPPDEGANPYVTAELPTKYATAANTPFKSVKVPGGTYDFSIEKPKAKK